jgi:hypothetical protein
VVWDHRGARRVRRDPDQAPADQPGGLAFPTGTATAETIKTIHVAGEGKGTSAAKALGIAALLAGALTVVRDYPRWIPVQWAPSLQLVGHDLVKWTIAIKTEVVLVGAGALMSFRTGWSMLLGAIVNYVLIAPALFEHGLVKPIGGKPVSYAAIIDWTLWPGAAILVGAGLTSFALDYKSIARAFTGLGAVFDPKRPAGPGTGIAAVEAPDWWFPAGLLLLTPEIVALTYHIRHPVHEVRRWRQRQEPVPEVQHPRDKRILARTCDLGPEYAAGELSRWTLPSVTEQAW